MKKESLKQQAYHIIKTKIVTCEYKPNDLLNEEQLQEEMGVSRTPIRDALGRLEQEKLVHILPKKGIQIAPFSIKDINSLYEARMIIEPYAVQFYGACLPEKEYREQRRNFSKMLKLIKEGNVQSTDLYNADDRFHKSFIKATENEYISTMYDQIYTQILRLRILSGNKIQQRLENTQMEHLKVVDLCLEKKWEEAAEAMREHLRVSQKASFNAVLEKMDIYL